MLDLHLKKMKCFYIVHSSIEVDSKSSNFLKTHNPNFLKVLPLVRSKATFFQIVNLHKTFHKKKES